MRISARQFVCCVGASPIVVLRCFPISFCFVYLCADCLYYEGHHQNHCAYLPAPVVRFRSYVLFVYFFCNRFGWFCCSNFIVVGVSIRKNTVREQLFVVFILSLGQFTQTISTSNNCNNSQNSLVVSFVKQNESFFFSSSSV